MRPHIVRTDHVQALLRDALHLAEELDTKQLGLRIETDLHQAGSASVQEALERAANLAGFATALLLDQMAATRGWG